MTTIAIAMTNIARITMTTITIAMTTIAIAMTNIARITMNNMQL